jgi:hypothetical protein
MASFGQINACGEKRDTHYVFLCALVAKTGMRQSHPKCKIFGQARRPAPTKACRGDPLWSPAFRKSDFDVALVAKIRRLQNKKQTYIMCSLKICIPCSLLKMRSN